MRKLHALFQIMRCFDLLDRELQAKNVTFRGIPSGNGIFLHLDLSLEYAEFQA